MKISRNSPCPCGSGKKYKRCCAGKDSAISPGEIAESSNDNNDDEIGRMILKAMTGMRMMVLEREPYIKQYKSIRRLHSEIISSMMRYYYQGKFDQKVEPGFDMPKSSYDGTYTFRRSKFDAETNEGAHGLAEVVVYPSMPGRTCITGDFIDSRRYRKPEKIEFLHSMFNSRPGLFEVKETNAKDAYVIIKNVFTGEEFKIVDIGLSSSPNNESIYLYSRIISYQGLSFNSGLNLIFKKSDPFIKKYIMRHKADYKPMGEFDRFIELYSEYSRSADRANYVMNRF